MNNGIPLYSVDIEQLKQRMMTFKKTHNFKNEKRNNGILDERMK